MSTSESGYRHQLYRCANARLFEPRRFSREQSEDELMTKEEPARPMPIGSGIAGKSSATVGVEVRILETPTRYIV